MQSAVVYITLPGETISLKSMISGNTIKTNKQDINITKQLEIETLHVGWFWVDQQKIAICHNPIYYQPEINDYNSEYYFCELSNGLVYNLNQMDFEGATKKNKPNIQVGQFLFSRVVEFNHYLKGKLSYINPQSKKEWEKIYFENCQGVLLWNYLSTLYKVFQVLKLSLNYLKKQVNILVLKFVLVRMVESGLKGLMLF